MQVTVQLPDDVFEAARSLAVKERVSRGDALAALVRRGLEASDLVDQSKPFPCFVLPPDAEPITLEQTLGVEDGL